MKNKLVGVFVINLFIAQILSGIDFQNFIGDNKAKIYFTTLGASSLIILSLIKQNLYLKWENFSLRRDIWKRKQLSNKTDKCIQTDKFDF